MSLANDNEFVYAACGGCSKTLRFGDKVFHYAEGIMVCEPCAPTWAEANQGFKRDAFENPDNWRDFKVRLRRHLANGGTLGDKCVVIL